MQDLWGLRRREASVGFLLATGAAQPSGRHGGRACLSEMVRQGLPGAVGARRFRASVKLLRGLLPLIPRPDQSPVAILAHGAPVYAA